MKIISREEAAACGERFFFDGDECKNGHTAPRTVNEGKCYECLKASWERTRRKKGKKPFQPNTAKRTALQNGDRYFIGSPCPHGHGNIRWAHNGACKSCTEEAARNHPKRSQYAREWKERNPERYRDMMRATKARRRAVVGKYTAEDVQDIKEAQRHKCAVCKNKLADYHVDHITPVAKGGTNDRRNLQLLCPPCNRHKAAKDPIDFMQSRGLLL